MSITKSLVRAAIFLFALPATAATFNVTKTADTADGACNVDCSLREAIIAANATSSTPGSPNVINLPAGTYDLNPSGQVGTGELRLGGTTNKGTNIVGAGAATTVIHQANSGFRVFDLDDFQVGGVSVTLSDLTISGGVSQTFGGGAILGGSSPPDTLSLTNVTITGSTGGNAGAGIKWTGGNVTIMNCVFTNNVSSSQGGAINYAGGVGQTLTITGSTFSGNASGNAIAGGALLLSGGFASFDVSNSTFVGNQATNASGVGGAIFVNSGTLTAAFNRFVGNSAGVATSGAVGLRGGSATLTNNWWGCNGGANAAGCDKADASAGITLNTVPYVVLSNTASPATIDAAGGPPPTAATLTASFLQNSSGTPLTAGNVSTLIGLPVTWGNAILGSLSGQQATIQATGTATATFTAGATGGTGHADATVDSGTATANIAINQAPAMTGQPSNQTVCAGTMASFMAMASGVPAPTVQWQLSTNGGMSFADVPGATMTTYSFTTAALQNGYQYRAVFTNTVSSTMSNVVALTVDTAPSISMSPADSTCQSPATFTVVAGGAGLTYQWQENSGAGFVNLMNVGPYSGVTTATLTITNPTAGMQGYTYQCVVSGTCTPPATSNAATLDVDTGNPSVTAPGAGTVTQTLCQ